MEVCGASLRVFIGDVFALSRWSMGEHVVIRRATRGLR